MSDGRTCSAVLTRKYSAVLCFDSIAFCVNFSGGKSGEFFDAGTAGRQESDDGRSAFSVTM
jgi:hypothetical protein